MWVVVASVKTQHEDHSGTWHGSRQVPTFILDETVQGILTEEQAINVARMVINPLGNIDPERIMVDVRKLS
jgi:hypothetical protein